jgi:hypothetical protein
MIKLDTVCKLAKSIKASAVKDDSGVPTTIAQLKFSELDIRDRDAVDELLGMPIGWCRTALYDEQGAPLKRFGVSVYGRLHRISGSLCGPKPNQVLSLLQAELEEVWLRLTPLGALAEGMLTWAARGDEVEDVMELLGNTVSAKWELTDAGQEDMFGATSPGAARATQTTRDILGSLGRGPTA